MNNSIYIDIGNSNVKWKYKNQYYQTPATEFSLAQLPDTSKIWVSNVSSYFEINSKHSISLVKSQKKYKSLINSYKDPDMLGSDRWLAMIASYENNSNKGFIVVDIGTAVTIDLVDNSGLHLGGVIFPGLKKIRNTFDYFPVSKEININEISQSTRGAWSIGTLDLLVNGINKKIHDIKVNFPGLKIYLTGGGFEEVEKFLDFAYYYRENLVLDGLELFADNMG